eukprot:TRINITY_DN77162_c0_g1_i1.p1 TRINITY_DN77162_c0_g1~~TRINITY_DN77162_c0_g1_i1.p1  ORF type:complete len:158 (+),score=17.14 TRINITY_DN77162_c0_g1_i1:213-686(+)
MGSLCVGSLQSSQMPVDGGEQMGSIRTSGFQSVRNDAEDGVNDNEFLVRCASPSGVQYRGTTDLPTGTCEAMAFGFLVSVLQAEACWFRSEGDRSRLSARSSARCSRQLTARLVAQRTCDESGRHDTQGAVCVCSFALGTSNGARRRTRGTQPCSEA